MFNFIVIVHVTCYRQFKTRAVIWEEMDDSCFRTYQSTQTVQGFCELLDNSLLNFVKQERIEIQKLRQGENLILGFSIGGGIDQDPAQNPFSQDKSDKVSLFVFISLWYLVSIQEIFGTGFNWVTWSVRQNV